MMSCHNANGEEGKLSSINMNSGVKYDASTFASNFNNNKLKVSAPMNILQSKKPINNQEYMTIMSSTLVSDNVKSTYDLTTPEYNNIFTLKTWAIFYFEIDSFMFWMKDYFRAIYPDLNLVLIIQLNDDKCLQEKVFFNKTKDNYKYIPLLSKRDMGTENKKHRSCLQVDLSNFYSTSQILESKLNSNSNSNNNTNNNNTNTLLTNTGVDNTFKINLRIISYTNGKILSLCSDEIFLDLRKENENTKYNYYQNLNMKYSDKKVGNLHFSFIYSLVETSELYLEGRNSFVWNSYFSNIHNFRLLDYKPELMFKYNKLENIQLKDNGKNISSKQQTQKMVYDTFQTVSFEMNICDELKNKNIPLDRLLELLSMAKKRYEFYDVLYNINNNYINKKAFAVVKLLEFKESVINLLDLITSNARTTDKILAPFCFKVLRKAFFSKEKKKKRKQNKKDSSNSVNSYNSNVSNQSIQGGDGSLSGSLVNAGGDNNFISEEDSLKNSKLIVKALDLTMKILKRSSTEEVIISGVNYIFAHFEDPVNLIMEDELKSEESKTINSDEFAFLYVLDKNNKYYLLLGEILFKMYEYQDCVQPLIILLNRILKVKKGEPSELIKYITNEKNKDILKRLIKIQECNANILANFLETVYIFLDTDYLSTIFTLLSIAKIKEITLIFKNIQFDTIHESTIQFLKGFLVTANKSIQGTPKISFIKEEEHCDLIDIFTVILGLIKQKIIGLDYEKLIILMNSSLLNYWYTICNILNNIEMNSKMTRLKEFFLAKKISEQVVDSLLICLEKNAFRNIDTVFGNDFNSSLNIKIMIMRTMFHCITLIENLNVKLEIKLVSA